MSERRSSFFRLAIESLSLATAFAFAYSAVMNAALFRLALGINYFSVATPQDVVLNGFLSLGFILAITVPTAPIVILVQWLRTPEVERWAAPEAFWRRAGAVLLATLIIIFVINSARLLVGAAMHDRLPDLYSTGLRLSSAQTAPCTNARVEWVGSTNFIARCGDKLVVFRGADDISMEAVRSVQPMAPTDGPPSHPR